MHTSALRDGLVQHPEQRVVALDISGSEEEGEMGQSAQLREKNCKKILSSAVLACPRTLRIQLRRACDNTWVS